MLRHSFCHIPRITLARESALWNAGVLTWEDIPRASSAGLSGIHYARCCEHLDLSRQELEKRNVDFFQESLSAPLHWRLFGEFRQETAYLDIETTGLSTRWNDITTIALYDGREVTAYIKGVNLDRFAGDILRFKQIVTFNGKCFDVPFIRSRLNIPIRHAQIDLRYVLRNLGYRGGLKNCERMLGVARKGVEEVDGFMAVLLWEEYRRGNPRALETLLAYNMADTVNLETLMVMAYNKSLLSIPFGRELQLPLPAPREIPYSPDPRTIAALRWSR